MLGATRTGPIGLDFGTEKLKMVQADFTRTGPCVRSAVTLSYPVDRDIFYASPSELKRLINEARHQGAFRSSRVAVSMPPDKVQFISLEYKCTPGTDPDVAVIDAIRERFGEQIGNSVIDYLHIRPEHKDQVDRTALIAVAGKQEVIDFLEFLRMAGLKVERLEIGPVAINRLISAMNPGQTDKVVLAINFGLERSYATVLWGRRLLLDRALSFGLYGGVRQVAEALEIREKEATQLLERHGVQVESHAIAGMDDEEPGIEETLSDILQPSLVTLASEIKRLMLYVASRTRGRSVHSAWIFGSLAGWPGIDEKLAEMTGLPLKVCKPFYGLATSHQAASIKDLSTLRGIAVATGLSLIGSQTNA